MEEAKRRISKVKGRGKKERPWWTGKGVLREEWDLGLLEIAHMKS